jgi:hypothetical protein
MIYKINVGHYTVKPDLYSERSPDEEKSVVSIFLFWVETMKLKRDRQENEELVSRAPERGFSVPRLWVGLV